ncbi:MAG: tRNA (adenosine(37)-N6)-dimethylallyltransferase MiaA [Pseudomonadota bacterium]
MLTDREISELPPEAPVLLAGPTASGKSELALRIAEGTGRTIVNADALQVYSNWQVLTARPDSATLQRCDHALYGHVAPDETYSVGSWTREVEPLLGGTPAPVIVGGTGLYFRALTEGLADIPPVRDDIRQEAAARLAAGEVDELAKALDAETLQRIDMSNPRRIQRAWEVQRATGRGLADWHDSTPPPLIALPDTRPFLLEADRDWLAARIAQRFDAMLAGGVLDEVEANLADWDPDRPSSAAIGAPELVAHMQGKMTLFDAREAAVTATRQYAKRQRTWFRARMSGWVPLTVPS